MRAYISGVLFSLIALTSTAQPIAPSRQTPAVDLHARPITIADVPPDSVFSELKRAPLTAGNVLAIQGEFVFSGQVIKADDVVIHPNGSIRFAKAESFPWVAVLAKRLLFVDANSTASIIVKPPSQESTGTFKPIPALPGYTRCVEYIGVDIWTGGPKALPDCEPRQERTQNNPKASEGRDGIDGGFGRQGVSGHAYASFYPWTPRSAREVRSALLFGCR